VITFKNLCFNQFTMNYNLETTKIVERIKEKNHKVILLQLADGLKPEAQNLVDQIKKETSAEVLIWLGDCFGACDTPFGLAQLGIDLTVQFGHNVFIKNSEGW
jgi:diphthamide biosynthesis enzyme Dph1/Dph2-like protein